MKLSCTLVAFLFSSSAFGQPTRDSLYEAPKVSAELNLTCSELFGWMDSKNPASVEETLKLIQSRKPKYLTQTVFAYDSRSLQSSSYSNPRAIVFGGNAETILAFNGQQDQTGYERLEVACFNRSENSFEFHDVAFPKEAKSAEVLSDLTDTEKSQNFVRTNGRAGRDCRQCHQSPSRPNWDAYPFWPGFYGAVDDSHTYSDRAPMFPFYPTYGEFEQPKWQAFYNNRLNRYQYVSQDLRRGNLEFGMRLEFLNGKRIVGDLKRLGAPFEAKKYQFAKALFCSNQGKMLSLTNEDGRIVERNVLEENTDELTKALFLDIAMSQMPKLEVISSLLISENFDGSIHSPNTYDQPTIPYYLQMYPGQDFAHATLIYVKDAYMLSAFKSIVEPLGVSVENWSMQLFGGHVHNYGLGTGDDNLRLALIRPFTKEFLSGDRKLTRQIRDLDKKEAAFYNSRKPEEKAAMNEARANVCETLEQMVQPH